MFQKALFSPVPGALGAVYRPAGIVCCVCVHRIGSCWRLSSYKLFNPRKLGRPYTKYCARENNLLPRIPEDALGEQRHDEHISVSPSLS